MRALVIGGSGQDGILVSAQLLSKGYEVISASRQRSPLQAVLSEVVDISAIGVATMLIEKYTPDRIYFLAAYHRSSEDNIPDPADDLLGSLAINAVSFAETLGALRRRCPNSRTVYASSCRIFGKGDGRLLDESSTHVPECAYGISKAAGMGAARMFRDDHGLFVASAILFNHESELRSSNFISKKLALAALRAKVDRSHSVSVGSLDAVADWGSARDYCQGMTAMLDAEQPDDFVLASGELRSVGDFAEECFNVVGLDWRNHVKSRGLPSFSRDWKLRGDASRLKCKSTWRPNHNFSDMVQDLVRRTEIEKKNGQRSSDFHSYL